MDEYSMYSMLKINIKLTESINVKNSLKIRNRL